MATRAEAVRRDVPAVLARSRTAPAGGTGPSGPARWMGALVPDQFDLDFPFSCGNLGM